MVKSVKFKFNPFELAGIKAPRGRDADRLRQEIAEAVLDEVLNYIGSANSPVAGEKKFQALSKEYKKRKAEESSSPIANLELSGDMLDALECVNVSGNQFELRIIDPTEAAKAHGHNTGANRLPKRQFIPEDGQTFKRNILNTIKDIALEFYEDGE